MPYGSYLATAALERVRKMEAARKAEKAAYGELLMRFGLPQLIEERRHRETLAQARWMEQERTKRELAQQKPEKPKMGWVETTDEQGNPIQIQTVDGQPNPAVFLRKYVKPDQGKPPTVRREIRGGRQVETTYEDGQEIGVVDIPPDIDDLFGRDIQHQRILTDIDKFAKRGKELEEEAREQSSPFDELGKPQKDYNIELMFNAVALEKSREALKAREIKLLESQGIPLSEVPGLVEKKPLGKPFYTYPPPGSSVIEGLNTMPDEYYIFLEEQGKKDSPKNKEIYRQWKNANR